MYEQDRSGTGGDIKERWIPNTGEYLLMDPAVTFLSKAGVALDPREASGSSYEVVLVGAKDRYYDINKGTTTHGNVYCNTGARFEVALVGGQTIKTLGYLTKGANGAYYLDEGTNGVYAKDGKEFYADGVTGSVGALVNGGTGLFVEKGSDGFVVAGRVDGERGFKLGIRPLNAQMAKPGYDLLLVFALRTARKSESLSAPATVPASDYIAVYDKKMLWRANLYIDETRGAVAAPATTPAQPVVVDWNDLHPWNAPSKAGVPVAGGINPVWGRDISNAPTSWDNNRWGYNEWNRVYDPAKDAGKFIATPGNANGYGENFTTLSPGDGKQVVQIQDSTWHCADGDNKDPDTNSTMSGAVIYCFPQTTSPFQYGEDLQWIRREIHSHWVAKLAQSPELPETASDSEKSARKTLRASIQSKISEYADTAKTTAPTTNRALTETKTSPTFKYYEEFLKVPGGRYSPNFRPGYGGTEDTYPYMHSTGNSTGAGNGKEPIGVDCGGLVYMSTAYNGSQYTLQNLNKGKRTPYLDLDSIDDGFGDYEHNVLKEIQRKDGNGVSVEKTDPLPHADLMVPGDIFYWAGYHVGFISWITCNIEPGAMTPTDIPLLESTYGSYDNTQTYIFGRVINEFSLQTYYAKNWRIGRIKQ